MNKQTWQLHAKEVIRANPGMTKGDFAVHAKTCPECLARRKTAKANINRRMREDVMRSCGLTKVRGAMGGTYWE